MGEISLRRFLAFRVVCLPSLPERPAVTPFIMAATSFSLEASSGDDAASPLRGEGKAEPFAKEGFKEGSKEGSVRPTGGRSSDIRLPTWFSECGRS